jgi:hypothetical protein
MSPEANKNRPGDKRLWPTYVVEYRDSSKYPSRQVLTSKAGTGSPIPTFL